jgi:prolyl oligopeptidase
MNETTTKTSDLSASDPSASDPFLWLEDVQGARALNWVEQQNARTMAALEGPDMERDREAFRAALSASDKIPFVTKRGPFLYNLWQDKDNPRGLWRRTTMASYRSATPEWTTLIDVDALGKAENENWVWHGCSLLRPDYRRGLVVLSRGGADASVVREFDLDTLAFVPDGFALPEAKGSAQWLDADTLLVAAALGDRHATTSGYARTVRRWRRGTDFATAETIFEGQETDVSVFMSVDHEPGFARTLIGRRFSFFDTETFLLGAGGALRKIEIPADAVFDVHREWLTVQLRSPWQPKDRTFVTDSLIAIRLDAFMAGDRDFDLLFEPSERRNIRGSQWSRNRLAISLLDDMRTQVQIAEPSATGWQVTPLAGVPEIDTAEVWCIGDDADGTSDDFLMALSGYLTPTSLHLIAPGEMPALLKQAPPRFDASGLAVTQHEAIARDGTRIPYFQVGPQDVPADGSTPTILYGYGGFEVSLLPSYGMGVGKGWLERGGIYVVANLRGGGEFGSAWHKAGMRELKAQSHDDFAAVADDLIRRRVTSPPRLACWGGSNGGLLVGNMLTRYPDRFGAVWCTVPLLDMRRYSKLLAGASWISEYGDPDIADDWAFLQTFSPYHLASADRPYPPLLLWTSARDDRVHPGHARKMAARLEQLGQPVYFYEPTHGGHGTSDFEQTAFMWAMGYAFMRHTIGRDGMAAGGAA